MKILFSMFLLFLLFYLPKVNAQELGSENNYDSTLAKKIGADEYGMKQYVIAFLKKGSHRSQDSTQRDKIQRAHLKNIMRLANEGKLIIAGPFLDDTDIRGIFIFDVNNLEEAKKLTESDPAVKAGVLSMELHPWYGPAILPETMKLNEKLEKKKITGVLRHTSSTENSDLFWGLRGGVVILESSWRWNSTCTRWR